MANRLALAGFKEQVIVFRRQVRRFNPRAGALQMRQFAQFLRGHGDLMRTAPAQDNDPANARLLQGVECMGNNVAARKLACGLGHDPRHIQRHVAIADHDCRAARQIGVKLRELRVAIVPADKGGTAEDIVQPLAGDTRGLVVGGAGRQDDGIVQLLQFGNRHVLTNRDIADKADVIGQRRAFVAA